MPTLPDFGFCGPSYSTVSPLLDGQRVFNLYPEPGMPTSKSKIGYVGTPGLQLYGTLPTAPVRDLFQINGRMFAVGGTHFYEVATAGFGIVTDFGAMGASTGTGPARMVANGTQLLVVDSSVAQIFNANPVGPAMNFVFSGFDLEYLDGFYFGLSAAALNQVNNSALLDGTTWPGLNFIQRTGSPDQVLALYQLNGQMWIFGQKNTEVWYDAGSAGFPLSRYQGAQINYGVFGAATNIAARTVQRIGNALMWLASDDRGGVTFYRTNGLSAVRCSTFGIEALMLSYGNISGARSFVYEEAGHIFHVTSFPNANAGLGATLAYDWTVAQQLGDLYAWHERAFLNAGSGNIERIRADCFASVTTASGATNYVGDYATGNIYKMGLQYTSDNGAAIQRRRISPHVSNQNRWVKHRRLEFDADIGTASIQLGWSDDGGRNFRAGSYKTITKSTAAGYDTFGKYYRLQLGRSRDRVYDMTITDAANPIRIANAYLDANPGMET